MSTWLHLQRYDPRLADHTVLIDAAIFPRSKLCGGGVGAWSETVIKGLSIDLPIPSLFISDVEFRYQQERWCHRSPIPIRMVERADFDAVLARTAVHRGLIFHENETLTDVKRKDNGLLATTCRHNYFVKAIVGADGALSMVRRALMPRQRIGLAPTIQVTMPANPHFDQEFEQNKLCIDFSPIDEGLQGYAWHFPFLSGKSAFMKHGIGDFRIHRGQRRVNMQMLFQRELQRRQMNLGPESWSSSPIWWYSKDQRLSLPNVLLVGDAAGIEPAFGGGIHLALSYGEIAARALKDAFCNKELSFRDYRHRVMSHFMGQHIADCTRLATRIYGGRENPLDPVRQFFSGRLTRRNLLHRLLGAKGV